MAARFLMKINNLKLFRDIDITKVTSRGCSSVGRAPALQAGGQEFESLHLHARHKPSTKKYSEGYVLAQIEL